MSNIKQADLMFDLIDTQVWFCNNVSIVSISADMGSILGTIVIYQYF